ncbi:MAG TPA: hypothetical protein VE174_07740 [Actinomycetota bacterium]|nr:hypothetical protein [Actinomycetota bacterium]
MKKLIAVLTLTLLTSISLAPASAGPTEGGYTSDNVEYLKHIAFEEGTATGMKVIGKYLYLTSWKSFSIYDVSDPLNPVRLSITPFGFKFENEDVATNGKIMIFSEQLPQNVLHVWDVEDKENPQEIGTLDGGGGHTSECMLKCKYTYSSTGVIVDLRDPAKPKLAGNWAEGMPASGAHDLNEVAPGLMLSSSNPILYLDGRKNPTKPKLLAVGEDERVTGGIHSNRWPNKATEDFVLFSSESNGTGRCTGANGAFMTWDTRGWKRTHQFKLTDIYQLSSGTYTDGSPPANGLGCSAHWFQEHPDYENGGLVALGSYEHGTRFVEISSKGKIKEVGYFVPWGGSTSASYWLTDEIVYAIDYSRGIDILKFNAK